MDDIKDIFAYNVKKYRKERGISQEELAYLCDLHRTYISLVERRKRSISLDNIARIAKGLNVSFHELFLPIK